MKNLFIFSSYKSVENVFEFYTESWIFLVAFLSFFLCICQLATADSCFGMKVHVSNHAVYSVLVSDSVIIEEQNILT